MLFHGFLLKKAAVFAWLLAFFINPVCALDRTVLPIPPEAFQGDLAPMEKDSTEQFPRPVGAPEGAPNIFLIMTDDVGFASASTFGGPVPTPNLDKLANQGLRYNQFHTTGICSPSRAALLTGRNHHAVGVGMLSDVPSPYPGYTAKIPHSAATIARVLRDNGYNTAMFGKDHNVPSDERSAAGPFDQWPTGRGFEYFYGFVGGDTDQWLPALYQGISPVDNSNRPNDYLLDRELADKTISWIQNQKAAAPEKPFFAYLATGSAHAPHQAPQAWIEKFKGQFDHGWDEERERILQRQRALGVVPPETELSARPDVVPAWDSLSDNEKKVYARFMEVYAAMLSYQDAQFGRIIDELERMGIASNTLVVFIQGDNGSSGEAGEHGTLNEMAHMAAQLDRDELDVDWLAENLHVLGSRATYQGYPTGWTYATNTPFPWFKTHASHLGGVRNGLVVSWPEKITQKGEVRSQYHHIIDVMPTLLEAAGIPVPRRVDGIEQQALDGKSMIYSFDDADVSSARTTQYYEVMGNRAIYHEGWLANTTPRHMPWNMSKQRKGTDTSTYSWELYNLDKDFSQSEDVAAEFPDKLVDLQGVFDREARANNVYPIHDTGGMSRAMRRSKSSGKFRRNYELWGRDISLSLISSPPITAMPFTLTAQIVVPESGADGVIVGAGSHFSGWSFYLHNGVPVAFASVSPLDQPGNQSRIAATEPLAPGQHTVVYDFTWSGNGGVLTIDVDGENVAEGDVDRRPEILAGNGETFDTGRDTKVPVSPDYSGQGVFTGEIEKITVKINLDPIFMVKQIIKAILD